MQLPKSVLISDEFELPGQNVQAAAPAAEYVPAPQSTQTLPAREYWPARHCKHRDDELAPMTEDLPAVQFWQLNGPEDANTIEYVPFLHLTHSVPM